MTMSSFQSVDVLSTVTLKYDEKEQKGGEIAEKEEGKVEKEGGGEALIDCKYRFSFLSKGGRV